MASGDQTAYESKRWQALALLCIAQFMVVLDACNRRLRAPAGARGGPRSRPA